MNIPLAGKWVGEFTYGEVYPESMQNVPVLFVIHISEENGIINGTCLDDYKHLFEHPATVEGFFENDFISFIKKYPCYFEVDEHGVMRTFPELPSHEIHYTGNLVHDTFYGYWEIIQEQHEEGEYYEQGTGLWSMKRAE